MHSAPRAYICAAMCGALACCLPAAAPSDLPGAGVDVDNLELVQV
jgi:hypothetical protein